MDNAVAWEQADAQKHQQSQVLGPLCLRFHHTHSSRNAMKITKVMCRFQELTHMGPLEDPVKLATRVIRSFTASQDSVAWATLPASEYIRTQQQSKL